MAKKIKIKKTEVKKKVNLELLYMTDQVVDVKDFERVLAVEAKTEIHVWPEIGIMEFNMPSTATADFETMTDYMSDEEDLQFMKERNVNTVYAITIDQEAFEEFLPYMKKLVLELGGFLCSDSDDFSPFYEL